MATQYQQHRSTKVTSPFGPDALLLARLSGTEGISRLFHYELELLSEQGELDPDRILGQPLEVALTLAQQGPPRYFHGIVTEFSQSGFDERMHVYRASVRPWFWLLTRTADCRIFQRKSVPDIVQEVCEKAGYRDLELRLTGSYDPREYCVQYRETDCAFLSRLLEEEGIFYFFEHAEHKHMLVLCDDVSRCTAVGGYESVPYYPRSTPDALRERDHLGSWAFSKLLQPGKFATRDYDFEHPGSIPAGTSSINRAHGAAKFEVFDYPAAATRLNAAGVERIAKLRVEQLQTTQMTARGQGDAAGLAAGRLFKLTGYPRADLNLQYLITLTQLRLTSNAYASHGDAHGEDLQGMQIELDVEAVDAREAYRPARITPRPYVRGTQTALVVGPKGEEIYTDEFGRVKVQFHWDRQGKADENSSCFIRVGQVWAGRGWGGQYVPRIGQEVIVSFLEGDPDDPLIIGSVYNGSNKPPYALPDNRTQSGLMSRSSAEGTGENFNELRFEDKKGQEQLVLHAERDHLLEVENDETHSVGHDRKKDVKNDETTTIGKSRTESVGENESIEVKQDQTHTIGGNRTLSVAKDLSLTITGARTEQVGKDEEVSVSKNRTHNVGEKDTLSVGKQLLLDAGEELTIRSGSASITLKKDGSITLKGKDITLQGSGKVSVKASGDVILKGSKVTQN